MSAQQHNLVTSWLAVATGCGEPISEALSQLNQELGTRYNLARLGQWRRGNRMIPQAVQDFMLRVAIEHAIREEGGEPPFEDDALDRLAARLCPPPR